MPRYQVSHKTTYGYASPVIQSHHLLHLGPRRVPHQVVHRHAIVIEPAPAAKVVRADYFGNPATLISIEDQHRELTVRALSDIEVAPVAKPDFNATPTWENIATGKAAPMTAEVAQFTCASRHARPSRQLFEFAKPSFPQGTPVMEGVRRLTERIFNEFKFDNATTDISTPVEAVLKQKSGVCQDFAHLEIAALRSLGLPARYVSGYILTHPPPGQVKLEGTDASHAWISVWSPDTGWVDFDPTNNLVNSLEHVTIAYGRDFEDVSPIGGVLLGGGKHSVAVAVDMRPVDK